MTFMPEGLYHSGFVVMDLERAVCGLQLAGIRRWTAPRETSGMSAQSSGRSVPARFRYAYSCEGPHHLELIQPLDAEVFEIDFDITFHHFGFWTDDLERDVHSAVYAGLPLEVAFIDDSTGNTKVTYHRDPQSGLRYELVPASTRSTWEERWASIP